MTDTSPVLQGRVSVQGDYPVQDKPGIGSRLAALGSVVAGIAGALSAFRSSSTGQESASTPLHFVYEPTQSDLTTGEQRAVSYRQISISAPQSIGQQAVSHVTQLQAHADRLATQQDHQRVTQVLDQLARAQGLPTYKEFHAQNGVAYGNPPDSGTLGLAQMQATQEKENARSQAHPIQFSDYSSVEHAQHAQKLMNYQAQVLEKQRQAALAEEQRQAAHKAWAWQKAAEMQRQAAKPVQGQTQQAPLVVQVQKTNQDAMLEQAFYDPRNPQSNILEQAKGPERLNESKLAQAELNIDILKAKGQLSAQQAQELSVVAKSAAAKNWLQHDGVDNGNGMITYRGVQVHKANAPMVAYADAKRYWDKNTHLSSQEIAKAAAQFAKGVYDFFIGEDINTLLDPKAALLARVLAGGSLALTLGGGFVEKAGLRVASSGVKYLFKDVRLLTTVSGHSPELSRTLEKVWKLNKPQVIAYEAYAKRFGKGFETEVLHLPNGGKGFVTIKPPEPLKGYPNSVIWEEYVDAAGKKLFTGKRTFHVQDGSFKHFHQKYPLTPKGPEYNYSESEYWRNLKDVFKNLSIRKGKR